MDIAVHINPALPHQVEHGQWFLSGLRRYQHRITITPDITKPADIHIISGPHYAQQHWQGHPGVILIDRAYYHDEKTIHHSMDWISIGWMRTDGGRDFRTGHGRKPVTAEVRPLGTGSIFLADYDGAIESADTVRLHPARGQHSESLPDVLSRHARAIGYQTSALVTAGLMGLEVDCRDKRNIMSEPNWLELLPYADWHYSEIQSGEVWQHLLQSQPPQKSL